MKQKEENMLNQEKIILKEDAIKILKPIFKKYNCMDANHCIAKEEILAETDNKNKKKYFKILRSFDIIKAKNGKYYYQEENEKNTKTNKKNIIIAIAVAVIVMAVIILLSNINIDVGNVKTISDDNITFTVSDSWTQIEDYPDGYYFYKFISNEASAALIEEKSQQTNSENADTEQVEITYKDYPASITVIYSETDDGIFNSIDEISEKMKSYVEEQITPDEYNIETSKTSQGYDILKIRLEFYENPPEIDYLYYIFEDGKTASISATTYNSLDEKQMKSALDEVANSFKWN